MKLKLKSEKRKIIIKNSKLELKKRAYYFALDVIKLVDNLPNQISSRALVDQLVRCATSIGANIIEAQAASSKRDFVRFFNYSLKSANETKFWLGLIRDSGKAEKEVVDILLNEVRELSNMLGASILTAKGKRKV